jgi:hypothetical protein
MTRPRSQDSKLDELLRLHRDQGRQMADLQAQVSSLSVQVKEMAPTVQQVADAVTFAKVGRTFFRFLMGAGIVIAPVLWWMADRWHLLAQLFKRVN